jgi:hypothetical protein
VTAKLPAGYKEQLESIDEEIAVLTRRRQNLERQLVENRNNRIRGIAGVRIVCMDCEGTGHVSMDTDYDPFDELHEKCSGNGYVWALQFDKFKGLNSDDQRAALELIDE